MSPDLLKYIYQVENGMSVPIDTSKLTPEQLAQLLLLAHQEETRGKGEAGSNHHRPTSNKQRPGRAIGKK